MKLSKLIPHTSEWLGIPKPTVESVAKYLRPAGLLSSGGRGPGGAEMTVDDKINLFLGVCGVETANRAAEHVRIWRDLIRISDPNDKRFAFLQSNTVRDFFFDLITKDLNGGPLDTWLKEAGSKKHEITLDFYIDEFSFTIVVSRYNFSVSAPDIRQSDTDTIEVRFIQPVPSAKYPFLQPRKEQGYGAPSRLIRRLDAKNIRGWGTCLSDGKTT